MYSAELRREIVGVEVQQVQSSGGVFDVKLDGDLVFSKKRMGRHAEPGEVLRLIRERVG